MDRRACILPGLEAAGRFRPVEDSFNHIRCRSQNDSPGTNFTVGPLVHWPRQMKRSTEISMRRSLTPPFDSLGDGETAARRARPLIGFEVPIRANQNRPRPFVQRRRSRAAASATALN